MKIRSHALLFSAAALLSSCSHAYGGGTVGTGLPEELRPRESSYASADAVGIHISGTLTDVRNSPLQGIELIVRTSLRTQRTRTDREGRFSIEVSAADDDRVNFALAGAPLSKSVFWPLTNGGTGTVRLVLGADRKLSVR